jgi:HPt (histidine-containing phosphotransfer) domain-containing protein
MYGEDSVRELVEMSLGEADKLVESLSENIPAKDIDGVTRDAHQLKGMASTMTLNRIFELSRDLEKAARSYEWDETVALLESIKEALLDLQEYLRPVLSGGE